MKKLYLDDLQSGDSFESGEYLVTAADIKAFAQQFDPQAFHLDEVAAETSFFHGLIASGWHTAAITMRLVVESVPLAHGIIGASVDLSWKRPVLPGERLRAKTVVNEVTISRSKAGRGIASMTTETWNSTGELCLIMNHKLVVMGEK